MGDFRAKENLDRQSMNFICSTKHVDIMFHMKTDMYWYVCFFPQRWRCTCPLHWTARRKFSGTLRSKGTRLRGDIQMMSARIQRAPTLALSPSPVLSPGCSDNEADAIAPRQHSESDATLYLEMADQSATVAKAAQEDGDSSSYSEEMYEDMTSHYRPPQNVPSKAVAKPDTDKHNDAKKQKLAVNASVKSKSKSLPRSKPSGAPGDYYLSPNDDNVRMMDTYEDPQDMGYSAGSLDKRSQTLAAGMRGPLLSLRSRSLTNDVRYSTAEELIDDLWDTDVKSFNVSKATAKKAASSFLAPQCHGFMEKRGGIGGRQWQERYFVLDSGCLYFYASMRDKQQRNQITVSQYETVEDSTSASKKRPTFKLVPLHAKAKEKAAKTYFFRCFERNEFDRWIKALTASSAGSRHSVFVQSPGDEVSPVMESDGDDFEDGDHSETYEDPQHIHPLMSRSLSGDNPAHMQGEPVEHERLSGRVSKTPENTVQKDVTPPGEDIELYEETDNVIADRKMSVIAELKDKRPPLTRQPNNPTPYVPNTQRPGFTPHSKGEDSVSQSSPMPITKTPRQSMALPTPEQPLYVDTQSIFIQQPDKPSYDDIYVALWNYEARASDELSFRRGDLILMENKLNEGWSMARRQLAGEKDTDFNGERGLIITAYVEPAYERLP